MKQCRGRSRIPFETGQVNIPSVSAQAVDDVNIIKGDKKPVCIEIKLANSPVKPYIEVIAFIEGNEQG